MAKKTITISKRYERKVNLSSISSAYDNILLGTFGSQDVEYSSEEELEKAVNKLSKFVIKSTENDIKEKIKELFGISQEGKNNAFIGKTGSILEEVGVKTNNPVKPVEKKVEQKVEKKSIKELDEDIDDLFGDLEGEKTTKEIVAKKEKHQKGVRSIDDLPEELKQVAEDFPFEAKKEKKEKDGAVLPDGLTDTDEFDFDFDEFPEGIK